MQIISLYMCWLSYANIPCGVLTSAGENNNGCVRPSGAEGGSGTTSVSVLIEMRAKLSALGLFPVTDSSCFKGSSKFCLSDRVKKSCCTNWSLKFGNRHTAKLILQMLVWTRRVAASVLTPYLVTVNPPERFEALTFTCWSKWHWVNHSCELITELLCGRRGRGDGMNCTTFVNKDFFKAHSTEILIYIYFQFRKVNYWNTNNRLLQLPFATTAPSVRLLNVLRNHSQTFRGGSSI